MQFDNFADFIAMGGHGFYVWLAYALTAAILVFNIVQPVVRRRRLIKEQSQRLRREKASRNRNRQEREDAPSA